MGGLSEISARIEKEKFKASQLCSNGERQWETYETLARHIITVWVSIQADSISRHTRNQNTHQI